TLSCLLHSYFLLIRPPPTEISTLSLHDALPIWRVLEGTCARIAAERISRTEIQELEALARPITFTASNQQSFRRSSELNRRFHRSEEHTSELQSRFDLVCRLLLEKKKKKEENRL